MQGELWQAVLRRIPAAKHDSLIVVTASGVELMVNKILRVDEHYLLLRARLAGATDSGRIIVLPYEQIENVAFGKILPEAEIQSMFGALEEAENFAELAAGAAPVRDDAHLQTNGAAESGMEDEAAEADEAPSAPAMASVAPKPSKSVLLARLRARLAGEPRMP
jgi:hypothetical protein